MIKYLHVPNTYALIDIKHVDHIGMFYTFKTGDTWLTLDNKRLFLTPDMDEPDMERGSEDTEDWPVMSPEELKEALANHPSYEELDAAWKEVQEEQRAVDPLERRTSCQTIRCNYSYDCYPLSTTYADCFRCSSHRCTYRRLLPNAIGPISGKRSEEEEEEEGKN
ncbi:hypothetical protein B0T10DRAFT_449768 [Thelonectria olida]|uniref:Uncharacterized protein n=1 Tax=Thelonectria olida TaxID=1576542 RepID=A0A9P9AL10_9HYPO|nr:hypothetical protein B0T10DRAFT_449768 [Thelonectria olida]